MEYIIQPRLDKSNKMSVCPAKTLVLRSEESLKSEMLNMARTSKYVKNTSVLSINKSEEDSLDRKDSSNLIFIVVINSY